MTRVPVTIRLTSDEHDRLRTEAASSGVTFSDLARERLGVQKPRDAFQVDDHEHRLCGLEDRVRVLEQLANRDY